MDQTLGASSSVLSPNGLTVKVSNLPSSSNCSLETVRNALSLASVEQYVAATKPEPDQSMVDSSLIAAGLFSKQSLSHWTFRS